MIKRTGNKFILEVFNPKHEWKLLGKLMTICVPDECEAFLTHFKMPEKHFYIKGLGYPINEELLQMLKNAGIEYIVIPESGKTGFSAYLAETEDYLHGDLIQEPLTEKQRSVPLKSLSKISIDEKRLKNFLYG